MKVYASPIIGKLPVNAINTDLVMKVLEPHWHEKTDTMKRTRGRIETVLNYATVRKFRSGDNPARWTGYLSELLARPSKIAPVEHHPALDYKLMGEFMGELRAREGIGALALEFTILTCARTAETLGAVWDEVDLDEKTWTVPANRIKAGVEHVVPLSKAALAILRNVRQITKDIGGAVAKSKLVFPNDRTGGQLRQTRCSRCWRAWDTTPSRCTDSDPASQIGPVRKRIFRATSPTWQSRTRSATKSRRLTGARPDSRSAACWLKHGRATARSRARRAPPTS